MKNYIGHPLQICGVEEVILAKGKGKGMTLLQIRNGKGLEIVLCPDRCMDIVRINFGGDNMGYFSPCGYVAPSYYEKEGFGFLRSFTAGFMTTCGFESVGASCIDDGESLPQHGTIGNTPCENFFYTENENEIIVNGEVRNASMFGRSYLLIREYHISKSENVFTISDRVKNIGNAVAPCTLLYHINLGYPLLDESTKLFIPEERVHVGDKRAESQLDKRFIIEPPQKEYEECCYYYKLKDAENVVNVGLYNPTIQKGVKISYDINELNCFTQWKMMGEKEYVLGLEPGNCIPEERGVLRKHGILKELQPDEEYKANLKISFSVNMEDLNFVKGEV